MRFWLALWLMIGTGGGTWAADRDFLLHAHNDYEHDRPLTDAFARGFDSIEVDVVLVGETLLVAHEVQEARAGRTLENLYLDNLQKLYAAGVLKRPLYLMIDIKTEADSTWAVLEPTLERYRPMLEEGAVTVILSGNRPKKDGLHLVLLDGRLEDLEGGADPELVPWISIDWGEHFLWRGEGDMPLVEQRKLEAMVQAVHAAGHRIRFWGTDDSYAPNRRALWRRLRDAGVDVINTDDLKGAAAFRDRP